MFFKSSAVIFIISPAKFVHAKDPSSLFLLLLVISKLKFCIDL